MAGKMDMVRQEGALQTRPRDYTVPCPTAHPVPARSLRGNRTYTKGQLEEFNADHYQ
jgi:hypothetical protein